ncbi:MAG: hypothetical protein NVSMB29_13690 [Candidatus Dormibacteria bacterium]
MTIGADAEAEAHLRELEELLEKTRRIRRAIEVLRKATGGTPSRPPRRSAPGGSHTAGRPRRSPPTTR